MRFPSGALKDHQCAKIILRWRRFCCWRAAKRGQRVASAVGGPDYYDGYYDGYYGPFSDGYWGNDGFFWYSAAPELHRAAIIACAIATVHGTTSPDIKAAARR